MSTKIRASADSGASSTVNGSVGRALGSDNQTVAKQKGGKEVDGSRRPSRVQIRQPADRDSGAATKRALKTFNYANSALANTPTLVLVSLNDTFATKTIDLFDTVKVGRKLNPKIAPEPNNGIFDSKVLSRNHAEIWFADGKVWVKDVKSSNGTFLNGKRLSEDNMESEPFELQAGARLDFGLDIKNQEETMSNPSAPEIGVEPARGSVGSASTLEGVERSDLSDLLDRELKTADETRVKLLQLKESLETLGPIRSTESLNGSPDGVQSSTEAATRQADETLAKELEEAKLEIQTLANKYNDSLSQAKDWESFKKQVEGHALEVDALKKQNSTIEVVKEEASRWKSRSDLLEGEITALKEKVNSTTARETASIVAESEKNVKALNEELKSIRDQCKTLSSERDQLATEIKALRQSLANAEKESHAQREQNQKLRKEAAETAKNVAALAPSPTPSETASAAKEQRIPTTPGKRDRNARRRAAKSKEKDDSAEVEKPVERTAQVVSDPEDDDGVKYDSNGGNTSTLHVSFSSASQFSVTLPSNVLMTSFTAAYHVLSHQILAIAAIGILSIGGIAYFSLGHEFFDPLMGALSELF
ncbi:hypothetical protein PhCBS80983_g05528 [Powellomyces hirtus]|uniref:FHA domain-containing protein n=1 Tax=Powellomyces hirtus TaxID=109895 RepID=A0A507DWE4_9FUNG|nr:hypothetical protein PhCBS80983_g05528 [Powellomyces hirtus]